MSWSFQNNMACHELDELEVRVQQDKHESIKDGVVETLIALGKSQDEVWLPRILTCLASLLDEDQARHRFWCVDGQVFVLSVLEAKNPKTFVPAWKCVTTAPSAFGGFGERLVGVMEAYLENALYAIIEARDLTGFFETIKLGKYPTLLQEVVSVLVDDIQSHPASSVVKALGSLADTTPESKAFINDFGGISALVDILDTPTTAQNTTLKHDALVTLQQAMNNSTGSKTLFGQVGGMSLCLNLARDTRFAGPACSVLATATCDHYLNKTTTNALDSLVKVVSVTQNPHVVQMACRAIYNLASESQPCVSAFFQVANTIHRFVKPRDSSTIVDPHDEAQYKVDNKVHDDVEEQVEDITKGKTQDDVEEQVGDNTKAKTQDDVEEQVEASTEAKTQDDVTDNEEQVEDNVEDKPSFVFVEHTPSALVVEACMAMSRLAYNTKLYDANLTDVLFCVLNDSREESVLDSVCCALTALLQNQPPCGVDRLTFRRVELVATMVGQAVKPSLASQACRLLAHLVKCTNNVNIPFVKASVFRAMTKHFEHYEFDHTYLPRDWVDTFILDHYVPSYKS